MRVHLRRYPNRRYYDSARSKHLTLDGIYQLIRDGHQVQVNDSKTGEDITVRVLAQLILEQAPDKLAVLPAELFHQIINSNESLLREFVDKYFYRALTAFIRSQQELDGYLRRALGLPGAAITSRGALPDPVFPFLTPNWAAMMMGPLATAFLDDKPNVPSAERNLDQSSEESDVRKTVEELKEQVSSLRKQLLKMQ